MGGSILVRGTSGSFTRLSAALAGLLSLAHSAVSYALAP